MMNNQIAQLVDKGKILLKDLYRRKKTVQTVLKHQINMYSNKEKDDKNTK
jgi:hypothetical protein